MGTLINAGAIIVATLLGMLFKRSLNQRRQAVVMYVLGFILLLMSLSWWMAEVLSLRQSSSWLEVTIVIVIAIPLGWWLGHRIDIEGKTTRLLQKIETKFHWPPLTQGFVTATVIFCTGAMAILGPIQDAISGNIDTLLVKSALDFVTAMMLASGLGVGVMFSALSVLIYQGGITLMAAWLAPLLTPAFINAIGFIGNLIIVAIAVNFLGYRKMKVANMLPSLLIPIVYFITRGILLTG